MSATATINYTHTVARLAGVDAEHLMGLDIRELDVLYYGILSDDVSASFRGKVDHLETAALESYALAAFHSPVERAYCQLLLARRDVRARRA